MAIENNRLASMVVGTDRADGGGPLMPGEGDLLPAALIATKLRAAGIECEIFNLVPTKAAVLRRDRIVIILAVALLTLWAWSYLLWLSADMGMGGMDMTGLRMIPSGMGLMVPAHTPWQAMEFAFVFVMWTVVNSGHCIGSASCPLYPQKRTLIERVGMSALCHVWTAPSWQEETSRNSLGRCSHVFGL